MTENNGAIWFQTTYYPFMHASNFGRGTVLQSIVSSPKYDSKEFTDVPYLEAISVHDDENGIITIFAVNRHLDEQMELHVDLRSFGETTFLEHIVLENTDLKAVNTKSNPNNVVPHSGGYTKVDQGKVQSILTKASWNVIRFKTQQA
jgi:alpha-N-arabinofuranosidase